MFKVKKQLKEVNKKKDTKTSNGKAAVAKKSTVPDLICKSFVDGCLVLGCIHDILPSELVVSLPGLGNFGHIKINNISKIYSDLIKNCDNPKKSEIPSLVDLFHKGDLIRCKVLSFTNNKLYLTMEPSQVNSNLTFASLEDDMILSGSVKTKEDHGYTIDLGIAELTGFFKVQNLSLPMGQVNLFKITSKKSKRAINLKMCDSNESSFFVLKSKYKFDSYLPGAQLDCTIEKTSKNGIHLSISNDLYGYVHINHIPTSKRSSLVKKKETEEKKFFNNGEAVSGTIIFINPYSKIIYMSLLPHLIDSTKVPKIARLFLKEDGLMLGNVITNALVHSHTNKGLFLKFNTADSKQVLGFVPKRHLFEKNDQIGDDQVDDDEDASEDKLKELKKDVKNLSREDLEQNFALNSTVKARIFDYSLIEDMILLSCRPSILESKYLTFNELEVGQTLSATVKKINSQNGGVIVKISEFVTGFIPKMHTGDIPLSEAMLVKKMSIGSEIKCKIIQLSPEEKKCVLTAKKSLIKSKLSLIDSYANLRLGLETYGVVISIQKYGILLQFLNEVKGLLPRQEISASLRPDEDLKNLYYVGQLIKCKVLDFNKEKQHLKLSLLMEDAPKKKSQEFEAQYEIGDLIESGTIVQVGKDENYFRVKLPKGNKNGIIYKDHLSDLDCLNEILFEYYKKEMKIENFMIIQYGDVSKFKKINDQKSFACHYLTLKKTLVDFYAKSKNKIAKNFQDLKPNECYHAWIKKILPNGLLIQLPHGLDGFCSNEQIKYLDQMKSSNVNGLKIGQSILVKINKLYEDKERFTTLTKTRHDLSIKNSAETEFMLEYVGSYLADSKLISDFFSTNESSAPFWNKAFKMVKIGSVAQVAVKNFNKSSRQIECLFINDLESNNFDQNSSILGYAFADEDEQFAEGQRLEALVLAFDPLSKAFCLMVSKKAVKTYAKNFDAKYRAQIICKKEQSIKAEILYVSNWFCILGLKAHALGRLAIMPLFKNNFTQLNTARALNDPVQIQNSYEAVEKTIRQKQVQSVSGNALAAAVTEVQDIKKSQSQFSYFSTGDCIHCLIKSDSDQHRDYILVVHDLDNSKRNKKKILREIAVLNETNVENETSRKRKSDEEPIIVKKKLLVDKKKSSADKENDKDQIEVVASVKAPAAEYKSESKNGDSALFPWEVTDFDQFEEIISKVSNESVSQSEPKKKEKPAKEKVIDDRLIYEQEEQVFDPNREPDNADDYERLIASKPNSSFVWIKYIVFYLQMAEIEKARAVAKQGLKTILYTEDQERLNVWVALLNLENMYGTQTSLEQAFNQACQNCDSYKIHCHMAEIFARSAKIQEAETIFIKMTRKFSQSPDAWIKYGIFHYKNSNCESARKLLIKSFNSLDKKDHIDMVNKFAQLEFKYGEVERAKTMYDSLLFTYPNRTDIWSVYIDMLVKHEKYEDARFIFNRIIQLGLTVKRMKFIFKKYLDFEKQHGTEEQLEQVKELVSNYVEKDSKTSESTTNASIQENLKKNLKI
ncbi:RRP5 -like protein [Brachionus plicatilis]|uniref:RRP5-like protein n=1 Tax=Brachionus plicatilis TaxID=10195 RepID=A0A3M7QV50_BRAPC|nr:RRP5 -like protein [Brachionus plicatilis]